MCLAGVGQLTETGVVQQIVGQLDLSAAAFELAEIAKAENSWGVLLRARQVGIGDDFVAIKHRPRPKGRAA